jgi:hypothetical protein
MTTHSRTWQTLTWILLAVLACAVGAAGFARLARVPAVGLAEVAGALLLLAGLIHFARARGRLRLLAALDAYAEREIDRERCKAQRAGQLV